MSKLLIYNRKQVARYIFNFENAKNWQILIVHHTFMPTISDFNKNPDHEYWFNAIDNYHRRVKGWKGFAYHFLIYPDGKIAVGRKLDEIGAHTVGQNHRAIGVCLFGNFDKDDMPEEQYISLKFLLAFLCIRFNLNSDAIYFHRDFAPKTCPGKKIERQQVRDAVQKTIEFINQSNQLKSLLPSTFKLKLSH